MSHAFAQRAPLSFISLDLYEGPSGEIIDPVDPTAARTLLSSDAKLAGILPFMRSPGGLYVAAEYPLRPYAEDLLEVLPRPRVVRAYPESLLRAHERVWGGGKSPCRFGEIAVSCGRATAEDVQRALDIQMREGGRIGEILASQRVLTASELSEILARQSRMTLMQLEGLGIDESLFDARPETFWRQERMVPVERRAGSLLLAVESPGQVGLETFPGARAVLATKQGISRALDRRYHGEDLKHAQWNLKESRPDESASRLLSGEQRLFLAGAGVALALALWLNLSLVLLVLSATAQVYYAAITVFKMWMLREPTERSIEIGVSREELAALDPARLPIYTILVPLRDEAEVLHGLVAALSRLDYPKSRLDIKLLIDSDDTSTLDAAQRSRLPWYFDIVVVPDSQPRTKPKVCNYGLRHARGEYVVIYDAEDIPEPDQLKKAILASAKAPAEVACIQAKLSYFNPHQNLLTRWFTAEYAMWFDLLLPALQDAGMPIPLGGTSNHFKTAVLREVGAWDPFNVTEDADLGVRLHKAGYRTTIVDSTTFEEANSEFINWVRQRSRWVKGYIQTWIVHMRHPLRMVRQVGLKGFFGFHVMVGGTPFTFLMNPLYWALTTAWFLSSWALIPKLFPGWVYYIGMVNLFLGNFAFAYHNMMATAKRGQWELVAYTIFAPLYWGMMSLAAWKALLQLVARPSHWEKTTHGLVAHMSAADDIVHGSVS